MDKNTHFQNQPRTGSMNRSAIFVKHFDGVENKRPLSVTIHKKTPMEVLAMLSQAEGLYQFFDLEKIENTGADSEKWFFRQHPGGVEAVALPMRRSSEPGSNTILWKAEDAAGFDFTVAVELSEAPAGRGTVVAMMTSYDTTMGEIAGKFEKIFGKDADMLTKKNLFRLKALCETGHIPTTEGQPSGRDEDQPQEIKH